MGKTPLQMIGFPQRFEPSKDVIKTLNAGSWDASFSGGKDSTALVTYIEALRRAKLISIERPSMTMSDTGVEYPFLYETSRAIIAILEKSGWHCTIVSPKVHQRLYCQIFGRGLPPIHPGIKRTRWCTRSTKQDPIKSHKKNDGDTLLLSGVRWGESDMRDGKLVAMGCAAGGECGLPEPGKGVYSPIITWRTCKVVEWLNGDYEGPLRETMDDLVEHTRNLVVIYDFKKGDPSLFEASPPMKSMLRFGCMGCPAIQRDKVLSSTVAKRFPQMQHLARIYKIWEELWKPHNRLIGTRRGKEVKGPIRMDARKRFYDELLSIQRDANVQLVSDEDDAFIRSCWKNKVYPRGWAEADESNVSQETGLFQEVK